MTTDGTTIHDLGYTRDVALHAARQLPPIALALAVAAPTSAGRTEYLGYLGTPLTLAAALEAVEALLDPEIARDAAEFVRVIWGELPPAPEPEERWSVMRADDPAGWRAGIAVGWELVAEGEGHGLEWARELAMALDVAAGEECHVAYAGQTEAS